MRSHSTRALAVALATALLIALALPGAAMAAGTLAGTVLEFGTANPIDEALVGLYEVTPSGGLTRVGWSYSMATGAWGSLTASDANTGLYRVRTGRPGYITLDTAPAAPIVGAQMYNPDLVPDPILVERLSDNDRYTTAVRVARERFTTLQNPAGWWGVDTIVIASGEDRAAADPLAAAGLCGVYSDTPLFLVSSSAVSSKVRQAVGEISATNGAPVRVVIVGGPASVPDARVDEVIAAMPNGAIEDRLIATGDRFDLAAAIAERIAAVRGGPPPVALVANGADADKFFDALALSTVSASIDYPILLVNEDSIPVVTRNALDQLGGPQNVYVGGGPATVSDDVLTELDARYGTVERWSGTDRYRTAIAIADNALAKGLLRDTVTGVAAKLPDALTGGATIGLTHGVLLITDGEELTPATGNWLAAHKAGVDKAYVIGGPVSVTDTVRTQVHDRLQ